MMGILMGEWANGPSDDNRVDHCEKGLRLGSVKSLQTFNSERQGSVAYPRGLTIITSKRYY